VRRGFGLERRKFFAGLERLFLVVGSRFQEHQYLFQFVLVREESGTYRSGTNAVLFSGHTVLFYFIYCISYARKIIVRYTLII
jgi:hypothetical protein